jgi:hypothetical protein
VGSTSPSSMAPRVRSVRDGARQPWRRSR